MTKTITAWLEQHRTEPAVAYLIAHHTATIAELADAAGWSIERTCSHMGGLHDYGIVTKYGNRPESRVRWDWPD